MLTVPTLHSSFSDRVRYRRHVLVLLWIISCSSTVHADPSASDPWPPADASSISSPSASKQADAAPESHPPASDPLAADPFIKGSRYWSVAANASCDATLGWVYLTQINASYYVAENVAIDYGGIIGYVNAERMPSGALGGPQLGLRWHVAKSQRWSTYLDFLAGAVYQQHPITPETLRFNFDLQPGVGATYRLNDTAILLGGFHWHHLSNSQVRGRRHNFGYDGPMLYVGLMRFFK